MKNAAVDLTSTINGRFAPADWQQILERAEQKFQYNLQAAPEAGDVAAWQEVVRDFYLDHYWGFKPGYRAPKIAKPRNLGVQFIWMAFNALCSIKVVVLWFGQIYSRSDEPFDKWIFLGLIFLVVSNFVFFLWRNHAHPD